LLTLFTTFCYFHLPPTIDIYPLSLHELFRSHLFRCHVPPARDGGGQDHLRRQVSPDQRLLAFRNHKILLGSRQRVRQARERTHQDRKSTRLNSSHVKISYAVFCLKKKKIESEYQTSAVTTPTRLGESVTKRLIVPKEHSQTCASPGMQDQQRPQPGTANTLRYGMH